MNKLSILGMLGFGIVVAWTGCVDRDGGAIEQRASALGGASGAPFCPPIGGSGASTDFPAVRGWTRVDGQHEAVFRRTDSSDIMQAVGTPLANAALLRSGALMGSSPWGYTRHDGVDTILYLDQSRHVHELSPFDNDLNMVPGVNAPIAAAAPNSSSPVPDVSGYVRSDNKSSIVYRSDNDHVIELKSNFGSTPPWITTDLTAASSATVTAVRGSAFPYVRSDGLNVVVYIGSDNHIHELAYLGSRWSDADLYAPCGVTVTPHTDPWGYKRSDGWNAVLYIASDGNLHEIAMLPGVRGWCDFALPAVSPVDSPFSRPSGYVRPDGVNAIAYVSWTSAADFQRSPSMHQLTLTPTPAWVDEALPSACAAPLSQPFGHAAPGSRSSVLFLGRSPTSVKRYEIFEPVGGQWTVDAF